MRSERRLEEITSSARSRGRFDRTTHAGRTEWERAEGGCWPKRDRQTQGHAGHAGKGKGARRAPHRTRAASNKHHQKRRAGQGDPRTPQPGAQVSVLPRIPRSEPAPRLGEIIPSVQI
jgi:hypothetical protein